MDWRVMKVIEALGRKFAESETLWELREVGRALRWRQFSVAWRCVQSLRYELGLKHAVRGEYRLAREHTHPRETFERLLYVLVDEGDAGPEDVLCGLVVFLQAPRWGTAYRRHLDELAGHLIELSLEMEHPTDRADWRFAPEMPRDAELS